MTLPATDNYTANALNQLTAVGVTARVHDADGNITDNGEHLYEWDAENRLIEIKKKSDNSTVATYAYDHRSRRITKTVGSTVTNFVYDGWNPIAEFSGTTLSQSYVWGMDLSGSMQGVGGVGGLLSVNDGSATYYPTFDGNGNVSEYVESTGTSVAHYEYDAFGQVVASGTKADDFAHQFSTKPLDAESGLHYYGYRFYDSSNGRWLGRDPLREMGGINVYAFVENDSVGLIDYLGLTITHKSAKDTAANIMANYLGVVAYTGDANNPGLGTAKPIGITDFEEKGDNGKCCKKVKKAAKLEVELLTVLPSDALTGFTLPNGVQTSYTQAGYAALVKHEDRRLQVYKQGDTEYLQTAELSGAKVTECGWVCRDSFDAAEEALEDYIEAIQDEAKTQFDTHVLKGQAVVAGDNWTTKFKMVNGSPTTIVTGGSNFKALPAPKAAQWNTKCPEK